MRLHFLGTGTSFGVPVIGCRCVVCKSEDPRNQRSRHCLALESAGRVLLVDTPPELRLQLVRAGIPSIDAAFLSHLHADHVHGIDDLRVFSIRREAPVPMYVAAEHVRELETRFTYIFDESLEPNPGTSAPEIDLNTFTAGEQLSIAGFRLQVLAFPHGKVNSYGFRIGGLGVVVDGKAILGESRAALEGVETLVINALWWGDPHPTHFNVEEAVAVAGELGARRTYLTHLTHRLDYSELLTKLPQGVRPAYDGLVVELGDG
ncbi:MAG: MBL fold metallo-hydrolase [Gemmatimonadota bacterium]|nr:MAG: MBL fold metallo-hydrolase [Gemmatimonadota bacterium]